jgi:DNA-binding beta-propeller fold protein YncE
MMRNVLGGTVRHRPSDPYGAWLDSAANSLYVVDASAETLSKVDIVTGRSVVLTRFQPDERETSSGPVFVDTVPTAVCPVGDSFLVSFLSASPFPTGASSVRSWRQADGAWSRLNPLVGNLTMTNDLVCLPVGTANAPRLVTVEYRTGSDFVTPSGRVQLINGAQRRVIAENLPLPTAAAFDPSSGDLCVATLTGSVFRMHLP